MTPPEQSEKDIESVLKVFATAAPPGGMEQRLVRRARLERASRSQTPRFRPYFQAIAGVAAAIALFAVWSFQHRSTAVVLRPGGVSTVSPGLPTVALGSGAVRAVPHALPTASPQPHVSWARNIPGGPVRLKLEHTSNGKLPDQDATDAPSQPAPPLPLTNQEKLLLAAAHRQASLPQLSKLRRPVWPLRDPADDEDFRKFFDSKTQNETDGETE